MSCHSFINSYILLIVLCIDISHTNNLVYYCVMKMLKWKIHGIINKIVVVGETSDPNEIEKLG